MSLVLEQDHVILHGVSWQTFQQLLADRGERCGVLLVYDRGTVELRVPSQEHEWVKTTLTQVVEAVAFARDLHYRSLGSTTFGPRIWREALSQMPAFILITRTPLHRVAHLT